MTAMQEIKENIKRLKYTIKSGDFNSGYIENCKRDLERYESLLADEELENEEV